MKTKCYSVRLDSLVQISDKCYLATAYDGSEDYIPAKFIFGYDPAVQKSNAYWIAAWILERKKLQYSAKKEARLKQLSGLAELFKNKPYTETEDII